MFFRTLVVRRSSFVALVSMAVLGCLSIPAESAHADGYVAGYLAKCKDGNVCVWADRHFFTGTDQGASIQDGNYESHLGNRTYTGTSRSGQDNVTSSFNSGEYNDPAGVFKDDSCSGYVYLMAVNAGDSDYTNDTPQANGAFDNQASSMAFSDYFNGSGTHGHDCQNH